MERMKVVLVSATLVLTLAAGLAFAQGGFYGRADPELQAALQSLDEAMTHLQDARNSNFAANVRARAYIALAMTELDPGANSFRGRVAPPN